MLASTDPCETANGNCQANADCTNDNGQPICTCKAGFALDGTSCLPQGGAGTPCPSDCWTWDETSKQCKLDALASCFTLKCDHDKLTIEFESKLFGVANDEVTPFGTNGPTYNELNSKWTHSCGLGECGMTVASETIKDHDHIVFSVPVSKSMSKITVDGKTDVYVAPVDTAVTFKCAYQSSLDVSSSEFTVKGAKATGETVTIGDFGKGFSLKLYTAQDQSTEIDATNLFIGAVAYADVAWSVTSAQTLVNFYVDGCKVVSGASEVEIIKDNCFSSSLGVNQLQLTKIVADSSKFSFVSFTMGDPKAIEMKATMKCTIKMCIKDQPECGVLIITDDAQCPQTSGYGYKATTFQV